MLYNRRRNDAAKGGGEVSEIVWGADIPVDRKMPDWLDRDAKIRVKWAHNGVATAPAWTFTFPNGHWVSGQIASFRLPADHPHYKQDVPEWAVKRAEELSGCDFYGGFGGVGGAFALYIAEHEEAPVDPDVAVVREILAAWYVGGNDSFSEEVRKGSHDAELGFARALAAYKATKGGEG